MKKTILLILISVLLLSACSHQNQKLIVYCYDSFASEWGPAPKIIPIFKEKYKTDIEFRSLGDAGQVLAQCIAEKNNPQADVIIGIDNNLLARAFQAEILHPYRPQNADQLPEKLILDPHWRITPFDYGYFAIIYDSEKIKYPPRSLGALLHPRFKDSLLLMDPRTSSPGLGFLLWTIAQYDSNFTQYWKKLSPNILSITDSWDSAYGMFTKGEAPLVLSYSTSPAYHKEYEQSERFKAALFTEGHYLQIEGAAILKNGPHPELAKKFLDFLLSKDFQKIVPLSNFMFPIIPETKLPESFSTAIKPKKKLLIDYSIISEKQEEWLNAWSEAISQ